MTDITRARRRALARQARKQAKTLRLTRRRSRLIGIAAAVFAVGTAVGGGAGLLLDDATAPVRTAEAPQRTGPAPDPTFTRSLADTRALVRRAEELETAAGAAAEATDTDPPQAQTRADRDPETTGSAAETAEPAPAANPTPSDPPAWQRYAVAAPTVAEGTPKLAIVIDDLGLNRPNAWDTVRLPGPLTLAFMTYAPGLPEITGAARSAGHELLVHVPMQPSDPDTDPGPNVLASRLAPGELERRLDWALSRFDGFVGINNHMGSAFTADAEGMRTVLAELRRRGLMFLDSKTIGASVGDALAAELGVPHATRDVFLDNVREPAAIRARLEQAARTARRNGSAIAIGHPYDETLQVLSKWLPELRERGIALVPVSALAKTGGRGPDLAELAE